MPLIVLAANGERVPHNMGEKQVEKGSNTISEEMVWLGKVCQHSNPLHEKANGGGLNLPSIVTLYKKVQVSRLCQFLINVSSMSTPDLPRPLCTTDNRARPVM